MVQRKVGQDMVVRKKPVQKTEAFVAAPKPKQASGFFSRKSEPVIAKPVHKQEVRIIKKSSDGFGSPAGYHSKKVQTFSSERPPARGGIMWAFAAVAIVALVVTIFSLITRSTVDLTLKQETYPVNQQVTLYTEPTGGQVAFKTARIVDTQSITVPSTTKQSVSATAAGKVKLFSTATKSVVIPAGTQLVSSEKKTFTTQSKVTLSAGTPQKPGSAEVAIAATAPGADYNIALDDLKLPAFPAVVARTTTPIAGGISGDEFTLNEAELTTAKATLQARIEASKPAAFLANQIPENFILPESMIQVSSTSFKTASVDAGVSVIAERTITGNMIEKQSLKQLLKNTFIPESDRGFMEITDIKDLGFELPITSNAAAVSENPPENATLAVYMKGNFTAQSQVDQTVIRTKIAHQKKADARTIISEIPGIISANVTVWPPWMGRIPAKVSAIVFNINYQSEKL